MEKIEDQLNNLYVMDVPIGVHQSIMRRINYRKLKPVLFTAFALLLVNFLVVAWHINAKLINAEFIDMAQDFFQVFSFNFSFLGALWSSFFEIISPTIFASAVLSFGGAIYVWKQIRFYSSFTKMA